MRREGIYIYIFGKSIKYYSFVIVDMRNPNLITTGMVLRTDQVEYLKRKAQENTSSVSFEIRQAIDARMKAEE